MRILIVDDDPVCLDYLEELLQARQFEVVKATNGHDAFRWIQRGDIRIVLSDWKMPGLTGPELCRLIRQRPLSSYVYFILITSLEGRFNVLRGLQAGADDFLSKPFRPEDLTVRLRAAQRVLGLESRELIIFSMAKLAESRDPETGAHLERMREYSRVLAMQLSSTDRYRHLIDADYIRTIFQTSPLHDIGKVGIPDRVLLKPGRLTPEEFEIMKTHTVIGRQTLEAAIEGYPQAEFLRFARDIVSTHHEKYDGTGYPDGLQGEEIPLSGRIVAVADVYDALTTKRVYKPAFSHQKAKGILLEGRGTAFDQDVVEAFLECEEMILAIKRRLDATPCPVVPLVTPPTADEPELTLEHLMHD